MRNLSKRRGTWRCFICHAPEFDGEFFRLPNDRAVLGFMLVCPKCDELHSDADLERIYSRISRQVMA